MANKSTKHNFTTESLIAYAVNLVLLGASVFTFIKAYPQLEELDERLNTVTTNEKVLIEKLSSIETVYNVKLVSIESKLDAKISNIHEMQQLLLKSSTRLETK